jgi:signal transduction histidine kinase/PAS domain-containing protein
MTSHREALEQLSTAIAMYGPDTRLKFHNTAFARLWGLDEAWLSTEPTNSEMLDALRDRRQLPEHADFLAFKRESLGLFTSLIEPLEELLHLPDGRTLRMVITPHPMGGLLQTFEDVTDRLTLERSYNTLIDVQRDTLDNLYEGVAVFGGDGRLKLSNPAYARVWGLSPEFLSTEPHVTDVVEKLRHYFGADLGWGALKSRIVDRAMDRIPMNARLDRVDGSVLSYAKVPLSDGGVLWSYLDITDSIRVERALRERNEALETADQLKSEFIANVSYELRTPLNAIIGFAEILNNQYFGQLNDRQKEYSRGVIEASNRLLSLINDILDLAMIEAGRMTLDRNMVDIHALAVGVFNLTRDWARKQNLEVEFDCATNIGTMIADERRLKQALFNLMSNSIKFTPPGGTVTLAAVRQGPDVIFTVSDTGVGITREDTTRVFEKFERGADREGRPSGVGLGLSLVKNFVELHGGRVEMESTPKRGTSVRGVLPTHTEPPAIVAAQAS